MTFTVDQMEISGASSLTSNESSAFVSENLELGEMNTETKGERMC